MDRTTEAGGSFEHWQWVLRTAPTSRVILTIYGNETGGDDAERIARYHLARSRLDAMRAALARAGIAGDRVMLDVDLTDNGMVGDLPGWRGTWVYPEFYLRGSEVERIMPRGMVC